MVVVLDSHKKTTCLNKALRRYLGLSEDSNDVLDWQAALHQEDLARFHSQTENQFSLDCRIKVGGDQYHWMNLKQSIFKYEEGAKNYYMVLFTDIHEDKKAFENILKKEERFEFAVTYTGIGVWDLLLEPDGGSAVDLSKQNNQLIWNDNMFIIFNVTPSSFQHSYEDFENCLHPHDREKVKAHIAKCFKNNELFRIEFRLISHPNEIRYIYAQAKATFDKKGRPYRLTGINQDISDLVNEKNKVKALYGEIKQNELKYRSLFEHSSDAIMLLQQGKFIECNDSTLRIYGCETREQFIGTHPSEFSPPYQKDGRLSKIAADDYIQKSLNEGFAFFPWLHCKLDGETFHSEVLLTPLTLSEFEGDVIQATVRDISEKTRLHDELVRISTRDHLTGVYNRGQLEPLLEKEMARSDNENDSFSILMIDIDFFKKINDTHGHIGGDHTLLDLTTHIQSIIPKESAIIRFGGDEFIVILPSLSISQAAPIADSILKKVCRSDLPSSDAETIKYSVSMGLASYPDAGNNTTTILKTVDNALYQAKSAGRNQIHPHGK